MEHYVQEGLTVQTSFDTSHFGDFEYIEVSSALRKDKTTATWAVMSGGSVVSLPVILNSTVYFACCDHNLYAVSLEDGREVWRFSTGGPLVDSLGMYRETLYLGSYDNNFYSLTPEGKLLWKFRAGDKITHPPVFTEGRVHFGCRDMNVYTLDAMTGELLWKFPARGPIDTIHSHQETVYAGSWDRNLYALDGKTGRKLWSFDTGGIPAKSLCFGDRVYVGSTGKTLAALGPGGRLEWKVTAPDGVRAVDTDGKRLFIACRNNNAYAYDFQGRKLWEFRTREMLSRALRVIGNRLYVGSCDFHLYSVDPETGKEIWRFKTNGLVVGCPSQSGNRLAIGSHDCNFYCLETDSGKELWRFRTSMSNQAGFDMEELRAGGETTFEVRWADPASSEKEEKYRSGEEDIKDYGEFSGKYIDVGKTHYLGMKKKGYIEKPV